LDLTSEPLSTINQRLINSSTIRSASFTLTSKTKKLDSPFLTQIYSPIDHPSQQQPIIIDGRSRHNGPLTATTNQIYHSSETEHPSQSNSNSTDRDRTFVHHSDSRPFKLGTAIQMKPMEDLLLSSANGRCRPCHRQNALRYKSIDQEQQERRSRPSTPNRVYSSNENSSANISRHQSIERRNPSSSPQSMKSFSFDINNELHPEDISWSVREKAKLFEQPPNEKKLVTGRENYV
jgi:hypothetical protein